jgi:NTE family protein
VANNGPASRRAVVLSGGGANGAYEIGVLKALTAGACPTTARQPLEPAAIAATSIGTFNAAVLLSNLDGGWPAAVSALEQVWVDRIGASSGVVRNGVLRYRLNPMDWRDEFRRDPLAPAREFASDAVFLARDWAARMSGFISGSGSMVGRFAELLDASTFLTPEPTGSLVRDVVIPARLRDSPVHLRVTATEWRTGTLRVFANEHFTDEIGTDIVRASGAIPGIFPPVSINGEIFVDGAVVLNTPLKPAIDSHCDQLHVIYLDPSLGAMPLRPVSSMIDAMSRMFAASFAATMRRDLDVAAQVNADVRAGKGKAHRPIEIHLYHPGLDMGGALGMLDFGRARLMQLIESGYQDAVRHNCKAAGCLNVDS